MGYGIPIGRVMGSVWDGLWDPSGVMGSLWDGLWDLYRMGDGIRMGCLMGSL